MLNEERVILMTHLASYEANEGKKYVSTGSYFRSDYIKMQTMKAILSATITFVLIVLLVLLVDFESFMGELYAVDLFAYAKKLLLWYALFVGSYGVISYVIYSIRYRKARKNLKLYFNNLKKLSAMYENHGPKGK